jgi:hypothetical protein
MFLNPSCLAFLSNCQGLPNNRWVACIDTTSHNTSSLYLSTEKEIITCLFSLTTPHSFNHWSWWGLMLYGIQSDTIQPCDTIQVRLYSDFGVKCAIIQVYGNSHNSQSDRWIGLKFYVDSSNIFSCLGLQFQVNRSLGRYRNTGQQRLYEFCYLLHFDLWTSYLVRILFQQGCGSWFWEFPSSTRIFNEFQYNLQVWQWFINVSESFSYKDYLFILAIQGKKG